MSQTLKFGNGTWATKKGSTLAYNDEDGNFKPLPFTYTGAGKGTRVNKEGLIEVVENDRPRIDYLDSEDGVFLLEKAATNLLIQSSDFTSSEWTKYNTTLETNSIVSPDGTLTATKLLETTSSLSHILYDEKSPTTPNSSYSFSIFVKKLNRSYVGIQSISSASQSATAFFDLDNGVLLYTFAIGTGYSVSNAKIEEYSNGWYRLSATFTTPVSVNYPNICLADSKWTNGSSYDNFYTGDVTKGVYVWGAQYEQSSHASSYIPTEGTIQTRVQETASGSGNSEVFNDSEGILYANIGSFVGADNYRQITISDGSINNYILIGLRNDTGNIYFDSPFSSTFLTDVKPINSFAKCAFKYKVNDFSFWLNGFKVGVDTTTSVPVGLDTLNFDIIGVNDFYGKTKEIGYYDEVLTDLELETLTSYRTWEAMVKELNLNIIHNE